MLTKKQKMYIMFLAMLTTALLTSASFAAEPTESETVTLEGFVSVLRDANDMIISVSLVTDEESYDVVLDTKGLELGEEMEGEDVEVEGIVTEQDDQKLLKVLKFNTAE